MSAARRPDVIERLPLWALIPLAALAGPVLVIGGTWALWLIGLALGWCS